jgi:hypothetical protein
MRNLEDIKPGDYITRHYQAQPTSIMKVLRVTKTQIITKDTKWRKSNGKEIGNNDPWSWTYIALTTKEDREYIKRQNLIYRVIDSASRKNIEKLPTEKLETILTIFKETEDEEKTK